MELTVLRCPQCGAEGRLTKREENGTTLWHCAYCGSKFTEESKAREYERLEAAIKSSLGSVINDALLREKTEKYYNLRSMLWEKINAKYIDSKAIIGICRDIKKLDPHDFLAEFFELANSADEAEVAEYVNEIDVYENELFVDLVIDFLLKSMCEEYIAPVNLLIERAYRRYDLVKLGEYMTRLEEEAVKIDADMYETRVPRDVFIAYSSKDIDTVLKLMNELENSGLSCFVAFRNLQHGRDAVANYETALKEAINNCKILVFVSSKNSRSFKCDAFDKELAYVRECDLAANPIYRDNYEALPQNQRKPRVEYRLDDKRSIGADAFMKEFFAGLDYCETLEKTVLRVIQCKKSLANPVARLEEERKIKEAEESRRAEEYERRIKAAEERALEAERKIKEAEESRRAEEARKTEEARRAEENRRDEESRRAEEARKAEENRRADEAHNMVLTSVQRKVYNDGVYEGQLKDGKRHGKGRLTYANSDVYEGDWKDDKCTGKGKYTFASGAIYDGDFVDGKRTGKGKFIEANGDIYEGDWKDNKRHGKGKQTHASGRIYEGDFVDGKFHGKGKHIWTDGAVYEGDFVDGNRTGKGKFIEANGDIYEGDWKDNKRHGKGKYTNANGDIYDGDFVDGKAYGKGKYTFASGAIYDGDFVDGKFTGKGKYIWTNGNIYEGDYVDGKLTGKGKYTYANGDIYDGDFVDGKAYGKGKYTYANGDIYESDFVDGMFHGKGIYTDVNGKREVREYKNGTLISSRKKLF